LLGEAAENETRIVQRDIGLNVVVLSDKTDLGQYYREGFSSYTLPDEYVVRLSDQEVANRLVPMLRRRLSVRSGEGTDVATVDAMLTGIGEEVFKGGAGKKPVFGMKLERDEVVIGGEIARVLGLERGELLAVGEERFRVKRALAPAGSVEDVTVYANLNAVQALFGLEGHINEIQAIECHCGADVADPLMHLRSQLEELLPGTRVLRRAALADARRAQRHSAERLVSLATPGAAVVAGLLVAALAWLNARERRAELGLLRTLGASTARVAAFVLGRTFSLAIVGALLGSVLGHGLASARSTPSQATPK
jgi:predicted lysophospholipase L1 biosynthesis ABC-type transport system permease subunit